MALSAPVVVVLGAFFVAPFAFFLSTSLYPYDFAKGVNYSYLTLENYAKFLFDPFYLSILRRTLELAAIVTGVSLLIAYPVAHYMSTLSSRGQALLTLMYLSPWLVSVVIKNYGWSLLLAEKGLVNQVLVASGVLRSPAALMWTEFAVVVGLTHAFLVFMILPIFSSLAALDRRLLLAAQNLGANRVQSFLRVTLPLSLPGVLAGSLMVFTLSTSAFITPSILGGARVKVMAYVAYQEIMGMVNWPFGSTIAFILLIVVSALAFSYQRLVMSGKWKVIFQ